MPDQQLSNKRILLIRRPQGLPKPSDFRLDHAVISRLPPRGGVLVQTLYLSIDPAMRGWMSNAKSYLPPVQLGTVMRASSILRVVSSDSSKFPVGAVVRCETGGVQSYAAITEKDLKFLHMIPSTHEMPGDVSLSAFLGVLGTTGLTAYFGLLRVGMPKPGDTVLVSGAAGATGSVVSQIARIKGCRVVGTAGSDEKCKWLEDNGIVDVAINYRSNIGTLSRVLRKACPNGADVVFDNVGSEFLEAALGNLARGARIVLCGAISQYNADGPANLKGPRNYMNLLVKRATMKGFVVFDYRKEYGAASQDLAGWIASGQLKHSEDVVDGIENFYPALMSLFSGSNKGKVVLRVRDEGGNVSAISRSKL